MTEKKLKELMEKSMSVDGAKDMAAAVRAYLKTRAVLNAAREEWFGQLSIGDIVCLKDRLYPQEIVAFVPYAHGRPHLNLKDLQTGAVEESVWDCSVAPFDEIDAADVCNYKRNQEIRDRVGAMLKENDPEAIERLMALIKPAT